jgi:hypothetical protein
MVNRQWRIAARPLGRPIAAGDFRWDEQPVAAIADTEVRVKVLLVATTIVAGAIAPE